MKLKHILLSCLLSIGLTASAANEIQSIDKVTSSVSLTTDVDYTITSAEPFATSGSIDIVNTDHAVIIFSNVRPSKVVSSWLSHVYINGAPAVNGENCQVKMYNRGAIVFPYGKDFKPLTCYTEANFEGEACDDYTEGHSGGFMKTITTAQLNNQISSFKLKRGYMVTFAIGTAGWGYSRCFIADHEDLEVKTLPAILNNKISSYRIFKWNNFNKKALADCLRPLVLDAVDANCSYTWGVGHNMGIDYETVVNDIYEDWPSPAACGSQDFACHMKTNNEPKNGSDDHPQDLTTILNNWQNLMRTGMRLCTPSSWDGSDYWNGTGFIKEFLDSVDARGWRCDIVDAHCYWPSGNFGYLESHWWPSMRRPIWISEWVWGASWNKNGAFADGVTEAKNAEALKGILNTLNNSPHVERYFYWNGERDPSRIYKDDQLTVSGKVYAATDAILGYNPEYQFIPRDTRIEPLSALNVTYDRKTGKVVLDWSDANGELSETINIQCKKPEAISFTTIGNVTPKDKNSNAGATYKYTDEVDEPGTYTYRIQVVAYNGKKITTDDVIVNAAPAQGTETLQHGRLTMADTEQAKTYFSESFATAPYVFLGSITNSNTTFYSGNNLSATYRDNFVFQFVPWQTSKVSTLSKTEELPFLALMAGNYKFGNLDCEVGKVQSNAASDNLWTDATEVTFATPFPKGVTPVVMTEILKPSYTTSSTKATSLTVRVFDVTNTGFKFIIYSEDASERKIALKQNVYYLAITPGFDMIDTESGIMIAAGHGNDSIYSSIAIANNLIVDQYNSETGQTEPTPLRLKNPTILTSLQSNNYPAATMLRRTNVTEKDDNGTTWTTGVKIKRIADHNITVDGEEIPFTSSLEKYSAYRDKLGWIAVAAYAEGGSYPSDFDTAIDTPQTGSKLNVRVINGRILVDGHSTFKVATATGVPVPSDSALPTGIYFVTAGNQTVKIFVK